jgi:hypothetical protein
VRDTAIVVHQGQEGAPFHAKQWSDNHTSKR